MILASEHAVTAHNLVPLARLVGWNITGCDPKIMGIGPVDAIKGLMKKMHLDLDKIDAIEVIIID